MCRENIIIYLLREQNSNNLHSIFFRVISDKVASIVDVGTEDKRGDGTELDEDVDSGTRGILERVTNGITDKAAVCCSLKAQTRSFNLAMRACSGSELFLNSSFSLSDKPFHSFMTSLTKSFFLWELFLNSAQLSLQSH